MLFTVPNLPYKFDALEPSIDKKTMEIHHDKHHATYVAKLNDAVSKHPELEGKTVEELLSTINSIPEDIRTAVRNHGGGHANHSLFWTIMAPQSGKPSGSLSEAITAAFGSLNKLMDQVIANGMGQFGSGWSWLVVSRSAKYSPVPGSAGKPMLAAYATLNQDSPLMQGDIPILGVDVWEHAYYLKYQNKRDEYLKAWWEVVNWEEVAKRFEKAIGHPERSER